MEPAFFITLPVVLMLAALGFREGLVRRLVEFAGVVVTVILTARFAAAVNPWVMERTRLQEGSALILTWAALFLVGLVISRLLAVVAGKLVHLTVLGWVDRLGGALCGAAFGILVVSVLVIAVSQVPAARGLKSTFVERPYGRFVYYAAPDLYDLARRLGGGRAEEVWQRVLAQTKEQAIQKAVELKDAAGDALPN